MASTSVTLGPHWDEFIALMLKEGRYGSTSELIRASLRLMEEQEGQRARLRVALLTRHRNDLQCPYLQAVKDDSAELPCGACAPRYHCEEVSALLCATRNANLVCSWHHRPQR